ASFTVEWKKRADGTLPEFTPDRFIDILCVGTSKGEICWYHPIKMDSQYQGMVRLEQTEIDDAVRGLACEVYEPVAFMDPATLRFGARLYILIGSGVIVNTLQVTVTKNEMTANQIASHNLFHFVREPTLI
ncbi:hypothetical protein PFISCL1PPCAC_20811, partial [Pristionchus fissidentatus]